MNLAELKAKIIARKQENNFQDRIVKQPPEVTDAKVTPNQEAMLLKTLKDEKASYYHFIVHFEGLLDERKLITAINKVLENQLALRTSFYKAEDGWHQRIEPFSAVEIKITDLSDQPADETENLTKKIVKDLAESPLNIIDGELFRLQLIRVSETNHLLAAVISHICCDFSSLAILNSEVITNYMQDNSSAEDKSRTINYLDYCHWVENKFTPDKINEKKEFWKNYLKTAQPLQLEEKSNIESLTNESAIADHAFLDIPHSVKEKTEALTAQYPYSLQVICLAVFVLTLFSRTKQNGFVIGTPTGGREKPELENLIGCFANLLVFNIEIDFENTFLEFLEQVRNNILQCYTHQDTPYGFIENAAPEIFKQENISLADTIFSVNDVSHNSFDILGMKIWMEMIDTFQAAADLTFIIYSDRELFVSTEYKKSVFSSAAIKKLQTVYLDMLTLFTENPEARIGETVLNS